MTYSNIKLLTPSFTDQMETIAKIFLILTFSIFFFTIPANSATSCLADSCHTTSGPNIRFPFRLNRQPARCGYPGFDLYCNSHNQTILNLTESGEFIVNNIDYRKQTLLIIDPDSCLPNRLLNKFTLSGSPFVGINLIDFTFLNCSYNLMELDYAVARLTLQCRSGKNYTFMPKDSHQVPATCRRIVDVLVPMRSVFSMSRWTPMNLLDDLELGWTKPLCRSCENGGGTCGYLGDSGLEIGCFWPSIGRGLPRNAKLGILIGVGIPILACLIVLVSYSIRIMRASILRSLINSGLPVTRLAVRSPSGLHR